MYISHLLQSLNVRIFKPIQHIYVKQIAQLAHNKKTYILKLNVTPKGDHWLSQRYSELYLNTLSKSLHWLSKKCRRQDLNSQPQRPLSGSIPSLMSQTARFYARLYYHAQTRAHNLLRQKVITYWVSAIVSYILTLNFINLLTEVHFKAFISLNITEIWRRADIELYNLSAIMKKLSEVSLRSFISVFINLTLLITLKMICYVNHLIDILLKKNQNFKMLWDLIKLIKEFKMSLFNNFLLFNCNNKLLTLNTHYSIRKRKLITMREEFLILIRVVDLWRITDKREQKKLNIW